MFMRAGCPNCESHLNLRGSSDAVNDCTSPVFEGLITLGVDKGRGSWVARWQRLEGYVAGTYAVKVQGQLPVEVVAALEEGGVGYVPYVIPCILEFLRAVFAQRRHLLTIA